MRVAATIGFFLATLASWAQAPQGINYQGIARDSQGKPVASKEISIRAAILDDGPQGDEDYAEVHDVTTNQFGLFTIVIGQGDASVGEFNYVAWATGSKWLKIEMDINGGSMYQLMGSQQLMSVPYALYAQYAGNSYEAGSGISINNNRINNTGDQDNNPTNEVNTEMTLGPDNKLRLTDAGGTKEADLTSLVGAAQNLNSVLTQGNDAGNQNIINMAAPVDDNDAATKAYVDAHTDGDSDASNEIQDLSLAENSLTVTNNISATPIDLSGYLDNTDEQDLSLNALTHSLNLSGDGTPVDLSAYLDNTDNQNLFLNTLTSELTISGGSSAVDLSLFLDNTDNQVLTTEVVDPNTRRLLISNGNSVDVDVSDADASVTNEIQDLSLSANTLSLTGDVTTVDLTGYLDNTDNQDLTLDLLTNTLNLFNDGTPVDLSSYVQDLNLNSNILSITNNASPTNINLTPYLDNTDEQDLTIGGNTLSLTNDATAVDLGQFAQTITKLGNTITLTNVNGQGGGSFMDSVDDADNNNTNEVQTLSVLGDQLTISGNTSGVGGNSVTLPTNPNAFQLSYDLNIPLLITGNIPIDIQAGDIDIDINGSVSAASDDYTVPANGNGVYMFFINGSSSGDVRPGIRVNGNDVDVHFANFFDLATLGRATIGTIMLQLVAGDRVQLVGEITSILGGNMTGTFSGYKL